MKKIILIILMILTLSSCRIVGYVEERHEGSVCIKNKKDELKKYEIIYFDDNIFTGDLVVVNVRKKSVKLKDEYSYVKRSRTLN